MFPTKQDFLNNDISNNLDEIILEGFSFVSFLPWNSNKFSIDSILPVILFLTLKFFSCHNAGIISEHAGL